MNKNYAYLIGICITALLLGVFAPIIANGISNVYASNSAFQFNNFSHPIPDQRARTLSEMRLLYPIDDYLFDLYYLNNLTRSYNTQWSMHTYDNFTPFDHTYYEKGTTTDHYYNPVEPTPYLLAYSQPNSTLTRRLTVYDYYGNGYNTGFTANNMSIIIETDCYGISIFKRGNTYEDRLICNMCGELMGEG